MAVGFSLQALNILLGMRKTEMKHGVLSYRNDFCLRRSCARRENVDLSTLLHKAQAAVLGLLWEARTQAGSWTQRHTGLHCWVYHRVRSLVTLPWETRTWQEKGRKPTCSSGSLSGIDPKWLRICFFMWSWREANQETACWYTDSWRAVSSSYSGPSTWPEKRERDFSNPCRHRPLHTGDLWQLGGFVTFTPSLMTQNDNAYYRNDRFLISLRSANCTLVLLLRF